MSGKKAYQFLRHLNPAAIRDIRATLDLGVPLKTLCKNYRGDHREIVVATAKHMAAHPELGVVRWTSGTQYVFVSEEKAANNG
jgi:hypothetical protein